MSSPALVRLRQATRETVGGLPTTFWWLWTSTLVNRLGSFVVTFLALYLTVDRGFSAAFAGTVASAYGLGGVFGSLAGGVAADRIGRRPTIMAAQSLAALSTLALGLSRPAWLIALLAAVLGFTGNAARPAISAVMADVVPAADRVRAYSLNYWAINIGFAVASAAAGAIAAHGYLLLFAGDAATTLLCAVVVFLRVPETRPTQPPAAAVPTETAGSGAQAAVTLRTVLHSGLFMALVGLTFLTAMIDGLGSTALPIEMGRHGFDAQAYGLVISLNGVLIVLAQIPLTRISERRGRLGVLVVAALLDGIGFWLTGFAAALWFYALTVVVWTAGEMLRTPANMGLVAELSPTHGRGRYQGVYSLAWQGASFLAPLTAGVMLTGLGAESVWTACLALGAVSAAGYVWMLRGRPEARPTAERAAAAAADARGEADVVTAEAVAADATAVPGAAGAAAGVVAAEAGSGVAVG